MAESFIIPTDQPNDANSIAMRRKIARALLEKASSTAPIQSPWQGAANMVNAAFAGWEEGKLDRAEREGRKSNEELLAGLMSGVVAPSSSPSASPAPASPGGAGTDTSAAPAALLPRFAQAEAQYGLPKNFLPQVAKIESNFNPSAANPASSARGLFQFTRGTARQYGLDNPMDPAASTDAAARLAADNKAQLTRALGREPTPGELYLAHQQGSGGASKLLANPNARAVDVVGRAAVLNNGGREDMTAAEFARRWTQKVAQNDADMPDAGAVPVAQETGKQGFAVPGQPAMDGRTFDQITAGQPLEPVFQSEGVSQPWMGTALQRQPAVAQIARAMTQQQPPARPADLPAPGAVPAVGQMPAQAMPDLSNENDAGMRQLQVASEQARQGQTPGAAQSLFARIAAAMTGQPAPASQAAPVAQATSPAAAPAPSAPAPAAAPSEGVSKVASAMRLMNSPYATAGQKMVAQAIIGQAFKDPNDAELKRIQIEKGRKDLAGDPLEREARQLDIDAKKRAAAEVKAPTTKVVKQADGSEVALQWDQATGEWVPLKAPQGGNAVGGAPSNPYALPGKPTEGQSKDAGFAGRMVESHNIINGLESVGTSRVQAAIGAIPVVGNTFSSTDKQRFEQAKRNFVTSILRKESGAAISQSEFEQAEKTYFPQVGDDPENIRQKREARELAIEGVMAGAGSGYKVPDTYKPSRGKRIDPAKAPDGIDAKVWQHMTPEERALWN